MYGGYAKQLIVEIGSLIHVPSTAPNAHGVHVRFHRKVY
jgi:hypothetical protein